MWLSFGGFVRSFRPIRLAAYPEEWGVEFWHLGPTDARSYCLASEPTWADFKSAVWYRDDLIADDCHRLVAFYRPGKSRGTAGTVEKAQLWDKPVYEFGG